MIKTQGSPRNRTVLQNILIFRLTKAVQPSMKCGLTSCSQKNAAGSSYTAFSNFHVVRLVKPTPNPEARLFHLASMQFLIKYSFILQAVEKLQPK
jgi:hypothetical protein